MQSTENQVSSHNNKSLKQMFSCLVDAMRFARRKEQLEEAIEQTQSRLKSSLSSLDGLSARISEVIQSLATNVEPEYVKGLESQIASFTLLAIEQSKNSLNERTKVLLDSQQSDLNAEKTKLLKSLDAFIASSPFLIQDKVSKVKLIDGAYDARGTYECANNIKYELTFDTKRSRLLSKELKLATLEKDIKIPISLGKTWLRKEQVPDYESVDQYFLDSAELAEKNMIAVFKHAEKDAKLKLVYSRIDHHSSLTVEYTDTQKSAEITSTPGLNKFLESEPLERAMERLWISAGELESGISGLSKLQSDDKDILEKLDCYPFFAKSWKLISPKVAAELKALSDNGRREASSAIPDGSLSETFVREKLSTLGRDQVMLLETLGLKER